MRHRTKLFAGSAVAVALLAGALFGGILAESPSAGSTAVDSPRVISEAALSGVAPGRHPGHDRQARVVAGVVTGQPRRARDARPRLPGAVARDGRRVIPASLERSTRGGPRRASTRPDRDARSREPGADPASVRRRRSSSVARHGSSRRTRRSPTASIGDAQIELGRYRAAFRTLRPDGGAEAESRLVRTDRLRPRAERRHGRGRHCDAARARRSGRSAGIDAHGSRSSSASSSSDEAASPPRTGTSAPRSRSFPATSTRSSSAPASRPRGAVSAARSACARRASDAIPLPQFVGLLGDLLDAQGHHAEARRQQATVAAIDRLLVAERRSRRPRVGRLPRRPRHPARADRRARPAGTGRPALDLRRRRPRLGARARRPLRRGRGLVAALAAGSGRRTRCSGSIAATRQGVPATGPA